MIITDRRSQSEINIEGETAQFRIASNAKAFRILIDGIYADKIGSIVRELLSNAWDAHVRSGNSEQQFEVRLPNPLNPTFSIRDFGCSMTHEFVMTSYSTLFESSKSESNTEVGAFGLGAKAFFAYTDACSLTCWLDGEQRVYAIRLGDDGVPEVRLVHCAASDIAQGVEVSFATSADDFEAFRRAALRCAYGFDTLPRFVGNEVITIDADFVGEGWRFWRRSPISERSVAVRQGCAVYPTNVGVWHVPHDALLIVDTPIGTANVTASRESLALTSDQRSALDIRIADAMKALSLLVQAEYHAQPTDVKRAKFALANQSLLGSGDFPTSVRLPFSLPKWDAGVLSAYDQFGAATLPKIVLLHDNGVPVKRRQLRLRALAKIKSVYVSTDITVLNEAKRILELDDAQVISIHSIPDVSIERKSTGKADGAKPEKKVLDRSTLWVHCNRNVCRAGNLDWDRRKSEVFGGAHSWVASIVAGRKVLYLTEAEVRTGLAKGSIDPEMRLDQFVKRAIKHPDIIADVRAYALQREMGRCAVNRARSILLAQIGAAAPSSSAVSVYALLPRIDARLLSEIESDVNRIVSVLRDKYPLLFMLDDTTAIAEYIGLCDSAQSTSKVA